MVERRVTQGDIIMMNPDPKKGHEQKGYRPFICISHDIVQTANIAIFAPVSTTNREYPLYVKLINTNTNGKVLCDQLAAYDYQTRGYKYVERVHEDMLDILLEKIRFIFTKPI